MSVLLAVAAGGAAGAVLRHLVTTISGPGTTGQLDPATFPWATLAINVVGSLLLALLPQAAAVRRRHVLGAFLGPGVMGGFTTLSTFSEETRALVAAGSPATAAAYALTSVAACFLAVAAARHLGERR